MKHKKKTKIYEEAEYLECEICCKSKKDARYEASEDLTICDSCLSELKENWKGKNGK